MNLFTNAATVVFWFFSKYSERHYKGRRDNATNEQLTEKNKNFEWKKVFELPWMFWAVLAFSLFQTSTASSFSTNVTELAEQRFEVSAIDAGWYSSLSQYAGQYPNPPADNVSQISHFLHQGVFWCLFLEYLSMFLDIGLQSVSELPEFPP